MKQKNRFGSIWLGLLTLIGGWHLAWADGFIVIPRPPQPLPVPAFPLEVKYHRVQAVIRDLLAETTVEQEFYNPNNARLEGYYLFPIPTGAVIKKFSMWIDGRETQAEMLDAGKARTIYEDIVRRLRDPALLEYDGRGVFKVRIFPIEPRANKRIKIAYQEILSREDQRCEYLYPLNTEKFSAKPLDDVSVKVEIESSQPLTTLYCPSHEVEILRHGAQRATVGFEGRHIKPDSDFRLIVGADPAPLGMSLLAYGRPGEDGFFFLDITPGFAKDEPVAEKDIVFVLDTSGSMAGDNLKQACRALNFCIANLNAGDRFEIIRFSTEAEAMAGRLQAASEVNRQKAREFIAGLKAIGGTNIEDALKMALAKGTGDKRPFLVVFITDGKPTIGETDEARLIKLTVGANPGRARVFTFGVGYDINTHLLDKITELTRAYRTYITPGEDIELKISGFYTRVQSPVLTDLELNFSDNVRVSKVYPHPLPDLFKGTSLSLFGRIRGEGEIQATLTGTLAGHKKEYRLASTLSRENGKYDFIPPLWAARRIGFLLDQIRLHGRNAELVDEVVSLAREYGIVTPYTSYLILEDEKARVGSGALPERDQTLGNLVREREEIAAMKKVSEESKQVSGAAGVQASRDLQMMQQAAEASRARMEQDSRLAYRDAKGHMQNLAQQTRNVQGRAVYQFDDQWIDSAVQKQKKQQAIRVRFATDEYFALLKKGPEAAQFMALGHNVRFVLNSQVYEIYE